MMNPANYKTPSGLYKAFIKALETLEGTSRGFFIANALWVAKEQMKNDILVEQLRDLLRRSAPKTVNDLKPIGTSSIFQLCNREFYS